MTAVRVEATMPAFRFVGAKSRLSVFLTVAVIFTLAAIYDWTRPPRQQLSVALYDRVVMRGYRSLLKPFSDRFVHCRFEPTCAHYSEEAMDRHGFPKGLWLTTSRIVRCMPWVEAGTPDPVPPPNE